MTDTDDELVEVAARVLFERVYGDMDWEGCDPSYHDDLRDDARAVLAAVRPKIEERERERCAKTADQVGRDIPLAKITKNNTMQRTLNSVMIGVAQRCATAIRSNQETE